MRVVIQPERPRLFGWLCTQVERSVKMRGIAWRATILADTVALLQAHRGAGLSHRNRYAALLKQLDEHSHRRKAAVINGRPA